MKTDVLFCGLKELGHLRLCKPHGFLLHPYLQPDAAVGLVEDDFAAGCGERNIQLILARLRDADGSMRHVPTIDNPLKESLR
jgi:hypothetical protein